MMNLKTDEKKENVAENQVDKKEKCKTQRKRDFTRSMESLNRLLKEQNQENNNKTINFNCEKATSVN